MGVVMIPDVVYMHVFSDSKALIVPYEFLRILLVRFLNVIFIAQTLNNVVNNVLEKQVFTFITLRTCSSINGLISTSYKLYDQSIIAKD